MGHFRREFEILIDPVATPLILNRSKSPENSETTSEIKKESTEATSVKRFPKQRHFKINPNQ